MSGASPLAGRRVVVTRAEPEDGPLGRLLAARGATVLRWPAVRMAPPEDAAPLLAAAASAATYDWIVFTSPRAVAAFLEACPVPPSGPRIAAVGKATAEALEQGGWSPEIVADPASGAELVRRLAPLVRAGSRVLFPASAIALPTIPDGLRAAGAVVEQVVAYRTLPGELDGTACLRQLASGELAAITFASPSAVDGLRAALGAAGFARLAVSVPAVAIGATTARALEAAGCPAAGTGRDGSLEGLARAVEEVLSRACERSS